MADSHSQVIIIGGGIGGAGAALMLGRHGVTVTLLEKEPEFTEGGYGLQLGPNITRMLRREGLFETIRPLAVFPKRLVFRNAVSGEILNWIDCVDMERTYGAPYLVMHRNDLLQTLLQAAVATGNVTLRNDEKVVDFTDNGDRVSVLTEKGEVLTAEVLLAADGVHSIVRRRFEGDKVRPTGYVAYRGTLPAEHVPADFDFDDLTVWMGPGLHFVQYGLRDGEELNQVAVFRSPAYLRGEEEWGGTEELIERFETSGLDPRVPDGVRNLSMVRGWPMADRKPLDSWTRGRVALLGDAAHATLQYLAQGAGQSLLDASSLARNLGALGSSPWTGEKVAAAWSAYEDERRATGSRVQTTSRLWGEMWHVDTAGAVAVRDWAFRHVDRNDYSLVDWLYAPTAADEASIADHQPIHATA